MAGARIAILGAGNLGTTLAIVLAGGVPGIRAGRHRDVVLWTIEDDVARDIAERRLNTKYLPDVALPRAVAVTTDLAAALEGAAVVLIVVPSSVVRAVAHQAGEILARQRPRGSAADRGAADRGEADRGAAGPAGAGSAGAPLPAIVGAAKGLEPKTYLRMSEVIAAEMPVHLRDRVLAISGPSIAHELSRGTPTAVVLACADARLAREVRRILQTPILRFAISRDIAGVELAGTLKNAYALALGLCDGLGLGLNTKAALIARALPELARLGVALGGRRATFYGLAGLGDLIGTGLSDYSRNRKLGEELARKRPKDEAVRSIAGVVEGVGAIRLALDLAARQKLRLPVLESIAAVLDDGRDPLEAIVRLVG